MTDFPFDLPVLGALPRGAAAAKLCEIGEGEGAFPRRTDDECI